MNMSFARSVSIAALVLGLVTCLPAATIQYVSIEGCLHWGGSSSPREVLDSSSPEFISNLDADGLGTFQFDWTNDTGTLLSGLTFSLFIDPDIGRDTNGFFNEYGEFISLSLPALAPVDAISFGEWEIDEPGYVFGDIYDNVWLGALDNSNAVPSSGPANDVSHALLFEIPQLLPGQVLSVTGTLSRTDAAGWHSMIPIRARRCTSTDTPSPARSLQPMFRSLEAQCSSWQQQSPPALLVSPGGR